MEERGVQVDHSSVDRWVQKFTPQLEAAFRKGKKHPVGQSWRMDETYIKIKGQWKYLYRAVDRDGQTIDFLLTAHRDKKAARRFLKKAIRPHGLPDKVTIDQSGANTAALDALQEETGAAIEIRQIQYLNNRVEQDHRAVKRIIRPMMGFHAFRSARVTLQGIELMHRIKKGQMITVTGQGLPSAEPFYSLAASFRPEMVKFVCQKLTQHNRRNSQVLPPRRWVSRPCQRVGMRSAVVWVIPKPSFTPASASGGGSQWRGAKRLTS